VDIGPGNSVTLTVPLNGTFHSGSHFDLIAVPIKTSHLKRTDLPEAVRNGKVPGAYIASTFLKELPDNEGRSGVYIRWRLERINATEGMVLTNLSEEKKPSPAFSQPTTMVWWIATGSTSSKAATQRAIQ
jgi:hypothetical protein